MKRAIVTVLVLLLLATMLPAGAQSESDSSEAAEREVEMVRDVKGRMVEKPQYGGTVNIARPLDPVAWDPLIHGHGGGSTQYTTMGSVYEMYMIADWSVDREEFGINGNYIPPKYMGGYAVLESYDWPDDLTFIMHIREGILYQDKAPVNGRELTAEDVKYSFERLLGIGEFAEAGAAPWLGAWAGYVASVDVIDRYTVKLNLAKPWLFLTEYLGAEYGPWIHPREVVDTYGDDYAWDEVVGFGPWQIEDYVEGSSLTFERHPNYYGRDDNFPDNQLPYADNFKHLIISDSSTQVAAFRTGQVDQLPGG